MIKSRTYSPIICSLSWILVSALTLSLAFAAPRSPLHFNVMDEEAYGESVTAIATLEDGSFILLQALLTNAGVGDEKGACRILYVPKNKRGINVVDRDGDDWTYQKSNNTLKVSTCTIQGGATKTVFKAKADGVKAHLTLHAKRHVVKPPSSSVRIEDDQIFTSEVLTPWADATLDIRGKGLKSLKLKGKGYLDHGRSNTLMPKVAKGWFKFRGIVGETPIILEVRTAPNGSKKGWIWHALEKGKWGKPKKLTTTELKSWTLNLSRKAKLKGEDETTTEPMPQLTLKWSKGGGSLEIKATKPLYRYEPAKAYGLMGRLAKSWVGDPITRTYEATAKWPQGEAKGLIEYILIRD